MEEDLVLMVLIGEFKLKFLFFLFKEIAKVLGRGGVTVCCLDLESGVI